MITSGFCKKNKRKLAETEGLLKAACDELTAEFKNASERRSEMVKFWTTTVVEESLSETENLRALYREILGFSGDEEPAVKNVTGSLKRGKFGHVSLAVLPTTDMSAGSRKQSANGSDQNMSSLNESSNMRMSMPQLPPVETGDDIAALMANSLVSGSRTKLGDYKECPEEFEFHEFNIMNKKPGLKTEENDTKEAFDLMNSDKRKNPPIIRKELPEREEQPQMRSSWAMNSHSAREHFAAHALQHKFAQNQKEQKTDWHNFHSHRSVPQVTPSAFAKDPSKLSSHVNKPALPKPSEAVTSAFNTTKPPTTSHLNSSVFQKHHLHNFATHHPHPQPRAETQRNQPLRPQLIPEIAKPQDFKFPDKHDFKHAPQTKKPEN